MKIAINNLYIRINNRIKINNNRNFIKNINKNTLLQILLIKD